MNEIKFVLLIIGVVLILFLMKPFARKNNEEYDNRTLPKDKVPNDKIVLVRGVSSDLIKQAVRQFCNLYNSQELSAIVYVSDFPNGDVVITFPYDIDFGRFCFFVNYMYYPAKMSYKADISGWATTKPNDMWVNDTVAGKKVMLYIPPDNTEYDSLYLTTEDNIGYKIAFADSRDPQVINPPKMDFEACRLGENEIKGLQAEEII